MFTQWACYGGIPPHHASYGGPVSGLGGHQRKGEREEEEGSTGQATTPSTAVHAFLTNGSRFEKRREEI